VILRLYVAVIDGRYRTARCLNQQNHNLKKKKRRRGGEEEEEHFGMCIPIFGLPT